MRWRWLIAAVGLLGVVILFYGHMSARQMPVARQAVIGVAGWPDDAPPLTMLLISDIHVAGPDMPPARLERIVETLNAHDADIVLIAGDLVSDKRISTHHYSVAEAAAPLGGFEPRLGVFAVLGNHDHSRDAAAFRRELAGQGITVLDNRAVAVGPLALIGVDDAYTGRADAAAAFASAEPLDGVRVLLSHSPDVVPGLPGPVALVAAGHTHCGQISLPLIGRLVTASRYGERFACGMIDDDGQRVIVGAGLGTSILPLRYGVPPDYWVIEIGPEGD